MENVQGAQQEYDQWIGSFGELLSHREKLYTQETTDNVTKGVFAGFVRESLDNPDMEYYIKVLHDAHPTIEHSVAYNLLLRAFQDDRMANDPKYPYGYDKIDKWRESFETLAGDGLRDGILELNLRQHLLSNVAERYKTVPLLINLMRERFGENPSILDIGCSQMHGGKKLVFGPDMGPLYGTFKKIELIRQQGENPAIDKTLSFLANIAMRKSITYGPVDGLDVRNIDDVATKRFAKSCSFYPEELKNPAKVIEYNKLEELDPRHQRVRFYNYDFSSNTDFKLFKQETTVDRYDFIIFSTVFYQVEDEQRTAMLVNAANMLSDNGIIIIQDSAEKDFDKKYSYVTTVIDGMHPEKGEQPILRWATGRCVRAIPEVGRLAFNGSTNETLSEALRYRIRP